MLSRVFHSILCISQWCHLNLSAYITGVVIVDEEYVEVDAIEIFEEIHVDPSRYYYSMEGPEAELDLSASEYFCLRNGRVLEDHADISLWDPKSAKTSGITY